MGGEGAPRAPGPAVGPAARLSSLRAALEETGRRQNATRRAEAVAITLLSLHSVAYVAYAVCSTPVVQNDASSSARVFASPDVLL